MTGIGPTQNVDISQLRENVLGKQSAFNLLGKSKTLKGIERQLRIYNPDCYGIHFQGEGQYKGDKETFILLFDNNYWLLFK